jgi:hypothetical protein
VIRLLPLLPSIISRHYYFFSRASVSAAAVVLSEVGPFLKAFILFFIFFHFLLFSCIRIRSGSQAVGSTSVLESVYLLSSFSFFPLFFVTTAAVRLEQVTYVLESVYFRFLCSDSGSQAGGSHVRS